MRHREIKKLEFLAQSLGLKSQKPRLGLENLCLLVVSQLTLPLPILENAMLQSGPSHDPRGPSWPGCAHHTTPSPVFDHKRNLCLLGQSLWTSLSPSCHLVSGGSTGALVKLHLHTRLALWPGCIQCMFTEGLLWQAMYWKLGVQRGVRLSQCPHVLLQICVPGRQVGNQGWEQSCGAGFSWPAARSPAVQPAQGLLASQGVALWLVGAFVLKGCAVGCFLVSSGCWSPRTVGKAVGILDYF